MLLFENDCDGYIYIYSYFIFKNGYNNTLFLITLFKVTALKLCYTTDRLMPDTMQKHFLSDQIVNLNHFRTNLIALIKCYKNQFNRLGIVH